MQVIKNYEYHGYCKKKNCFQVLFFQLFLSTVGKPAIFTCKVYILYYKILETNVAEPEPEPVEQKFFETCSRSRNYLWNKYLLQSVVGWRKTSIETYFLWYYYCYSTVLSVNTVQCVHIWQELELQEPEPKINNLGSAPLIETIFLYLSAACESHCPKNNLNLHIKS